MPILTYTNERRMKPFRPERETGAARHPVRNVNAGHFPAHDRRTSWKTQRPLAPVAARTCPIPSCTALHQLLCDVLRELRRLPVRRTLPQVRSERPDGPRSEEIGKTVRPARARTPWATTPKRPAFSRKRAVSLIRPPENRTVFTPGGHCTGCDAPSAGPPDETGARRLARTASSCSRSTGLAM